MRPLYSGPQGLLLWPFRLWSVRNGAQCPLLSSARLGSPGPRLLSNPAPQVQAVARETGTVFCSFHSTPSEPCKRISHVTGKNTTVELCLLMRTNRWAPGRVSCAGFGPGASHRAPSSPRSVGVRGRGCTEPPDSGFSQAHRGERQDPANVETAGAVCHGNPGKGQVCTRTA